MPRHRDFAAAVKHELLRSERYCTFVSMLALRFPGLDERLQARFAADSVRIEAFKAELRRVIRATVRRTDLVSEVDRGVVGLLLAETPSSGADVVATRLTDTIRAFLQQSGLLAAGPVVQIDKGSFPGTEGKRIDRLLDDFFR